MASELILRSLSMSTTSLPSTKLYTFPAASGLQKQAVSHSATGTTVMPTTRTNPLSRPLYLIVATSISPPLGIGFKGTLPWPQLKTDMSFFARITKRLPPQPNHVRGADNRKNAVIMGRRTWESIPARFRPLKDRINVVITRSDARTFYKHISEQEEGDPMIKEYGQVLVVNSLPAALDAVEELDEYAGNVGKTFIIGGSEIYTWALQLSTTSEMISAGMRLRIVQTQVRRKDGGPIDCDTFFPTALGKEEGWKNVNDEEVEDWVGERLPQNKEITENIGRQQDEEKKNVWKNEGDFQIRILGLEKIDRA